MLWNNALPSAAVAGCVDSTRAIAAMAASAAAAAQPNHGRDGAMIVGPLIRHAPVDVIVHTHAIAGTFAKVEIAQATAARGRAAAVVVADQILLAVAGILAGADPGHLRHGRIGRALATEP